MQAIPTTVRTEYSKSTLERARIALICSPFTLILFITMIGKSVSLSLVAGKNGLVQGYIKKRLSELLVENELGWLTQVGILRREVDGQGLTDSFRITPLGREVIAEYQRTVTEFPRATLWQKIQNFCTRWFRLPL